MRTALALLAAGLLLAVPARAEGTTGAKADADGERGAHCVAMDWKAPLLRDHPLAGCSFDGQGRPVAMDAITDAVAAADYVLLGETHDNGDHHALQGALTRLVGRDARASGSLVLEMVPRSLQPVLDAPEPISTLGDRLQWAERGWPQWGENAPTIAGAISQGRALVAGDLDRDDIRRFGMGGDVTEEERAQLRLDGELPPAQAAQLAEELKASHCGMLPDTMIAPMATMQRARDGALAAAMREADRPAVLLAGRGHVRRDRGVPALLDAPSIAIAFMEVREGAETARDYELTGPDGAPLYDFVVFTPAAERGDPCAGLRERFGKKGSGDE